jgi:hypothetical protein
MGQVHRTTNSKQTRKGLKVHNTMNPGRTPRKGDQDAQRNEPGASSAKTPEPRRTRNQCTTPEPKRTTGEPKRTAQGDEQWTGNSTY